MARKLFVCGFSRLILPYNLWLDVQFAFSTVFRALFKSIFQQSSLNEFIDSDDLLFFLLGFWMDSKTLFIKPKKTKSSEVSKTFV
jgi:hypothetical protein